MNRKAISIQYITSDINAIEPIKSILMPFWPDITIYQTAEANSDFAGEIPDIIFIDASKISDKIIYDVISNTGNIPVVIVTNADSNFETYESISDKPVQVLSAAEFKSNALKYVIIHLQERCKLITKLKDTSAELVNLTTRDDLTGLHNRRYIDNVIEVEFKKAKRYKNPISALILGIDDLKTINESYGHDVGNIILCEFAALLQNMTREVDITARLGSDEYIVLLPATTSNSATRVAERIQEEIHKTKFARGKTTQNPTASIGISEVRPSFKTSDEWINALRRALLEAKHCGKDQFKTIEDAEAAIHPKLSEDEKIIEELNVRIHKLTEETKQGYFKEIINIFENGPFYKRFLAAHAERVAFFAERLSRKLGMSDEEIVTIKRSGMLHDIGKVAIDKKILLKSHKLSTNEFDLVKQHPIIGLQLLGESPFWKNEMSIILHHHEWYNGEGYPDQLAEKSIPLGARILAIAEAWDTMTTDQPYRPALPLDKAISEMKQNIGTQFDPELASTFVAMIEN